MRKHAESASASRFGRPRRAVAVAMVALALASGCVTQEPPGSDYVEDLQSDFETEDYFNP
jgi:hypothetical protein